MVILPHTLFASWLTRLLEGLLGKYIQKGGIVKYISYTFIMVIAFFSHFLIDHIVHYDPNPSRHPALHFWMTKGIPDLILFILFAPWVIGGIFHIKALWPSRWCLIAGLVSMIPDIITQLCTNTGYLHYVFVVHRWAHFPRNGSILIGMTTQIIVVFGSAILLERRYRKKRA
jgi:hypothetical protein